MEIKFGRKRGDSMKAAEQLIAINIVKSIILLNLQDPGNPIELTFQGVRFSTFILSHSFLKNEELRSCVDELTMCACVLQIENSTMARSCSSSGSTTETS